MFSTQPCRGAAPLGTRGAFWGQIRDLANLSKQGTPPGPRPGAPTDPVSVCRARGTRNEKIAFHQGGRRGGACGAHTVRGYRLPGVRRRLHVPSLSGHGPRARRGAWRALCRFDVRVVWECLETSRRILSQQLTAVFGWFSGISWMQDQCLSVANLV